MRFSAVIAKGITSDEACLCCTKQAKAGQKILLVRGDGFDLFYCPRCIVRGAEALEGEPVKYKATETRKS